MAHKKWQNTRIVLAIGFILATAFIVVALVALSTIQANTSISVAKRNNIGASVFYTDKELIITNNDNFDWENAKLDIRFRNPNSRYILKTPVMKAGQTYVIEPGQFTKNDDTRLKSFTIRPQKLRIECNTLSGRRYCLTVSETLNHTL